MSTFALHCFNRISTYKCVQIVNQKNALEYSKITIPLYNDYSFVECIVIESTITILLHLVQCAVRL